MPPKKKVVRTVRAARKTPASKAAAAAAAAAAETPSPETAAVAQVASADDIAAPAAANTESSLPETTPSVVASEAAPLDPAPESTDGAGAAAEEVAGLADAVSETAVSEPVEAHGPDSVVSEPADVRATETTVSEPVEVQAPEATISEPAEAPGGSAEMAEAAAKRPGRRVVTKVRKVTRRVPVKRTRSAAAAMEEKGGVGEGSQETRPVATTEQEGNPSAGEAAVSVSAEQIELASNSDQPSAPDNITSNVGTAVSAAGVASAADQAPPAMGSKKRIRKVKIIKRRVKKAEASQKEEKMEEAEAGKIAEKPDSLGADVNLDESSKTKDPSLQVEASKTPNGAPQMLVTQENAVVESGEHCSRNGVTGEILEAEKEKGEEAGTSSGGAGDVATGAAERQPRRKTEIFIGGLDRSAKEEDLRKVFGKVGEIVEIRLMMDGKTGKNKGYSFLKYATAAQAKQAVKEFAKVEICGKQCGAAALEGNDTIFLGNIDKKWKKDDVIKLLHEIGIEKIDTLTIMPDPKNADCNRGFAFLELETNRDAQIAFKKLQKKDVFGKGLNIKVAWAETFNDPDEEEMQKVKSVYAEGIPSSWDEKKVRECFKMFGQIERVVLSRNMQSAKRKDFAFVNFTTREAALSCIEAFDKKGMSDKGSKVNLKVSLAKPVPKGKQNKAVSRLSNKNISNDKPKAVQRETKIATSSDRTQSFTGSYGIVSGNNTSTTQELLHVLREQATWKEGQPGYPIGAANPGYGLVPPHGVKRPFSVLGDEAHYSDPRGFARVRVESAYPVATTSYSSLSDGTYSASLPHYQQTMRYGSGSIYGAADGSRTSQFKHQEGRFSPFFLPFLLPRRCCIKLLGIKAS